MTGHQDSIDEKMRMLTGVDDEPFTDELERELIANGWKAEDVATLRAQGAMYNRRRNSAVTLPEFDFPDNDNDELAPEHRSEKVGRNDPCPCGSGKKFKKCHGATH